MLSRDLWRCGDLQSDAEVQRRPTKNQSDIALTFIPLYPFEMMNAGDKSDQNFSLQIISQI